jgi:hypothetical protein
MSKAQQCLAPALVLVLVGCCPDLTGILAADKTGNLLEPPALREHPLADIRAQCGTLGTATGELHRQPYMQSVTATSAKLLWTSSASTPETVAIWGANGERTEQSAEIEDTHYLAGARQLRVNLDGLAPSTVYCYELHDASGATVYGPMGFRTAPTATSGDRVDIAVFGDSGFGSSDQAAVAAQLETVPIDFILHVGDVAYDTGTIDQLENNHFAMYREIEGGIAFFPAIGDHDQSTDAAGPFREVFALPGGERSYSFDWGPVHVLVLDCFGNGAEEAQFVEQDLSSSGQPWKIVISDEPPYSSGFHGSAMEIRNTYAPIFARNGVAVVFSGDDHDYERSEPIDGVTYIVTGGGGRSVRPVGTSEWTAFSVTAFHFVYVSVEGDQMRIHAIDATGREFDGVEIPMSR